MVSSGPWWRALRWHTASSYSRNGGARTTEWLLIAGPVVVAVLADLLWEGPVGGVFVYVLAVLPGLIAFLAWRTLVASTFVSLAPLYFVIAGLTRGRSTYAPDVALDRALSVQPAWMLVYGSLYVFVVLLPVLVVRQPSCTLIRSNRSRQQWRQ